MRFQGFIGPSYTLSSVNVDCQRCVNLYPEPDELGTGKAGEAMSLIGTPGLKLLLTLPTSPVRGTWRASDGSIYAVGGNKLYSVSSAWVATELGSLNTSSGAVSISDNGLQVVVVDGPYGYVWTIGSATFAQITDPNFPGATQVTFQDGYFLFVKPGSQVALASPLNAVTPFDALDIATIESSPDNLAGLISINQQLYLFGSQSIEVYYDSGATGFPFERIQGAAVSTGCSAAFSIAKLQGVPYWVGGDDTGIGIVYRMGGGYQPQRISTSAIESVIKAAGADNIANARAWTYQQSGHLFYCLNVPGTNSTLVYDASTSLWHERTWLNLWSQERHRADCSAVAYGLNIVGDYASGNIYSLDSSTYTDNGTSIVRTRTAPHIYKDSNRITHSRFLLDMEVGIGLSGAGQGIDPQVVLDWSDDGGHGWSNEHWKSCGPIGKTRTRVYWDRLGASRDRVYRVRISDPVKIALIGAELDIVEGSA